MPEQTGGYRYFHANSKSIPGVFLSFGWDPITDQFRGCRGISFEFVCGATVASDHLGAQYAGVESDIARERNAARLFGYAR
jgi:hypothetical protein